MGSLMRVAILAALCLAGLGCRPPQTERAQRRIPEDAKQGAIELLRGVPDRRVGICIWAHPDARQREERRRYAQDFVEVFERAGWIVGSQMLPSVESDYPGVVLISFQGNNPPANPDFAAIKKVLDRLGIPYREVRSRWTDYYVDPVSTLDPVIYIGSP